MSSFGAVREPGLIRVKVEEVRKALVVIEEDGDNINLILHPTKKKAFCPTQHPAMLKPLICIFQLDVRLPSE